MEPDPKCPVEEPEEEDGSIPLEDEDDELDEDSYYS